MSDAKTDTTADEAEMAKAREDVRLFGVGFVMFKPDRMLHVPVELVSIKRPTPPSGDIEDGYIRFNPEDG